MLWLDLLVGLLFLFLDKEWLKSAFELDGASFVCYSIIVLLAGVSLAMHVTGWLRAFAKSGDKRGFTTTHGYEVGFSDMSANQLTLLVNLYPDGKEVVCPTSDILWLVERGYIVDSEGYDLCPGDNPHEVTLTPEGRDVIQSNLASFHDALDRAEIHSVSVGPF